MIVEADSSLCTSHYLNQYAAMSTAGGNLKSNPGSNHRDRMCNSVSSLLRSQFCLVTISIIISDPFFLSSSTLPQLALAHEP